MLDAMSRTPDEDIGMRALETKKARAVETALARMRHGLGTRWNDLPTEQIEELSRAIGSMWAFATRSAWQDLHFGLLSIDETRRLIRLSSRTASPEAPDIETLEQMLELLRSKD